LQKVSFHITAIKSPIEWMRSMQISYGITPSTLNTTSNHPLLNSPKNLFRNNQQQVALSSSQTFLLLSPFFNGVLHKITKRNIHIIPQRLLSLKEPKTLIKSIQDFDIEGIRHAVALLNWYRKVIMGTLLFVILTVIFCIILSWKSIRKHFSSLTLKMTQEQLEQRDIQDFSQNLLTDILKRYTEDKESKENIAAVISDIIVDPYIRECSMNLIDSIMKSEDFKNSTINLSKAVLIDILRDERTSLQLSTILGEILKNDETEKSLILVLKNILNDPTIISQSETIAGSIITEKSVEKQVNQLFQELIKQLLRDPIVISKVRHFLSQTVKDEKLQEVVGQQIWDTMRSAVIPSFLVKIKPL